MNNESKSYRAAVVETWGAPPVITIVDHPMEAIPAGHVRVKVASAGASYVDALLASGSYQVKPSLPFVPGSEFSGTIVAVGNGVDATRVGQRVAVSGMGGGFAQSATVPSNAARPIPTDMPMEVAAVFMVSYGTALYALEQRGRLKAGETVLVLGAAGAIGLAAVQIASLLGAHVVAVASSDEKRALALDHGAKAAVDSAGEWAEAAKQANGGRGFDVIVDPVGGEMTVAAFRKLAWGGRHLVIGFAAGTIAALPANLALLKGASLVGVDIRQAYEKDADLSASISDKLFSLYASGRLQPHISTRFQLDGAAEALAKVASGAVVGRAIVQPRQSV
ncbi:MAG: hypothetical protein CL949_12180 [Erythrobacter sp.]|nr:hypothetical protein [Erythrobacter sp.]|tara:strand:+ start:17 stop:1021 length:1005 start_codon:yes stop_codon:yes gene_type:complete